VRIVCASVIAALNWDGGMFALFSTASSPPTALRDALGGKCVVRHGTYFPLPPLLIEGFVAAVAMAIKSASDNFR